MNTDTHTTKQVGISWRPPKPTKANPSPVGVPQVEHFLNDLVDEDADKLPVQNAGGAPPPVVVVPTTTASKNPHEALGEKGPSLRRLPPSRSVQPNSVQGHQQLPQQPSGTTPLPGPTTPDPTPDPRVLEFMRRNGFKVASGPTTPDPRVQQFMQRNGIKVVPEHAESLAPPSFDQALGYGGTSHGIGGIPDGASAQQPQPSAFSAVNVGGRSVGRYANTTPRSAVRASGTNVAPSASSNPNIPPQSYHQDAPPGPGPQPGRGPQPKGPTATEGAQQEGPPPSQGQPPTRAPLPVCTVTTIAKSINQHNLEIFRLYDAHLKERSRKSCKSHHPRRRGHRLVLLEAQNVVSPPVAAYLDLDIYLHEEKPPRQGQVEDHDVGKDILKPGDRVITRVLEERNPGAWIRTLDTKIQRFQVYTVRKVLDPVCSCELFAYKCDFLPKILRHATEFDVQQRSASEEIEKFIQHFFKDSVKEAARRQGSSYNFRMRQKAQDVVQSGLLDALEFMACEVSLDLKGSVEEPPMATIHYMEVDEDAAEREKKNSGVEVRRTRLSGASHTNASHTTASILNQRCFQDTMWDVKRDVRRIDIKSLFPLVTGCVEMHFETRLFLQFVPMSAAEGDDDAEEEDA